MAILSGEPPPSSPSILKNVEKGCDERLSEQPPVTEVALMNGLPAVLKLATDPLFMSVSLVELNAGVKFNETVMSIVPAPGVPVMVSVF